MKLTTRLSLVILPVLMLSCSLMPPRRQYMSEVKHQNIPREILNSEWALETFDSQAPDCGLTMKFLEKGQFTFTFKGQLYAGDNLWYVVKDSVIEFQTRPLEKIAWTTDDCKMNPSIFALYLLGDKK